jgi:hypothetical protein
VQRAIPSGIRYVSLSPDGVGASMMISRIVAVGVGAHVGNDLVGPTKVPTGTTVVAKAPPMVHPATPTHAQDGRRADVR